jgi:4-amino-4-deoxy-L-arabinose transferase-like glycosyltransferase
VLPVAAVLGLASFVRFWHLADVGFNSDEAVYAGTAASIAGDDTMRSMFPVFRAHPVLFQAILSIGLRGGVDDWTARAFPAAFGVATVAVTYLLGRRLYGHAAGLVAALLLAVMPYHVVVSRQVLLDGLMTLCATGTLYCVARYAETVTLRWLIAAGGVMGLTVLSKETGLILLGGVYAFVALTPVVRLRGQHLLLSIVTMVVVIAVFPVVLSAAGRIGTGQHYLLWQIFRRPNHGLLFYFSAVPTAIGLAVIAAGLLGLVWLRGENTWRERLLVCWMVVPVLFFTLWPVKGYQYLLPIAPVLAVLAGRTLSRLPSLPLSDPQWWPRTAPAALAVVLVTVSLAVPTAARVDPTTSSGTFLAGTGGLPGGREAGEWVGQNVPLGAQLLTIGPSIANVLQFYGHRRVRALSVSANPRSRNPAYTPVPNPDRALRNGEFQYLVWDSYTANRTPFFAEKARKLVERYHGVAVFTATVPVRAGSGVSEQPVIVIYEVSTS